MGVRDLGDRVADLDAFEPSEGGREPTEPRPDVVERQPEGERQRCCPENTQSEPVAAMP